MHTSKWKAFNVHMMTDESEPKPRHVLITNRAYRMHWTAYRETVKYWLWLHANSIVTTFLLLNRSVRLSFVWPFCNWVEHFYGPFCNCSKRIASFGWDITSFFFVYSKLKMHSFNLTNFSFYSNLCLVIVALVQYSFRYLFTLYPLL